MSEKFPWKRADGKCPKNRYICSNRSPHALAIK